MKVIHLTTVDMSLRFLVYPQLKAIRDAGGDSIGVSAPGPWVERIQAEGIRHRPLPASTRGMNIVADLRSAIQLWRILRNERPDILHTHNPKPGLYGRLVGRLAGVPLIVNTVHGLYATEDDPLPKRILVYLLEAIAARLSDAELVQNPEDLVLMKKWRLAPPGHTRLLGNGVDLDRFDPGHTEPSRIARIRHELGAKDGQLVVGMVGRLVAEKGYPEFFSAQAALDDRFVFVAVGPHDPDKDDAVDPRLLEDAQNRGVRFLGMRDDVEELYRAMDIFVLPSHREGFPRAAMEAAAMGLPIVATDIRGCRQVVDHGINGLLVPKESPQELAAAISIIGSNDDLRKTMTLASREKAIAEFDEKRVVDVVMETYRDIAVSKGMVDLMPSRGGERIEVRVAAEDDAAALARLHATSIEGGFLPRLGQPFLRHLYRSMISYSGGVVLVADDGSQPVGFVAGLDDVGPFYRYFLRNRGLLAAKSALPRLIRPTNLRRAWETLRYGGEHQTVPAELVSMAVVPSRRRQGVGHQLGVGLLDEFSRRNIDRVRVVVGADNTRAIAAYHSMGFEDGGEIEVHSGEPSVLLVYSSSKDSL